MALVKFQEVVVARPFTVIEHEFVGQQAVGIKSRRDTAVGEVVKLDVAFAREVIGALKAFKAGTPEAEEILASVKAEKPAKKGE